MTLLLSYARERLMALRVAAGVVLVSSGAQVARGWRGPAALVVDISEACLLVVAFRVWDDLMDRERDRLRHPDRITVRCRSANSLSVAAVILWVSAVSLVPLASDVRSLSLLLIWSLFLAVWYHERSSRSLRGNRIVLLKYAVFTVVLVGIEPALTIRGALTATTVYLSACVYEWAHDAESPVSTRARSVETVLLAAACVALVLSFRGLQ